MTEVKCKTCGAGLYDRCASGCGVNGHNKDSGVCIHQHPFAPPLTADVQEIGVEDESDRIFHFAVGNSTACGVIDFRSENPRDVNCADCQSTQDWRDAASTHVQPRAADVQEAPDLGEVVREAWVAWAREQPDVDEHPSWLVPWADLPERDREVDRRIAAAVRGAAEARIADLMAFEEAIGPGAWTLERLEFQQYDVASYLLTVVTYDGRNGVLAERLPEDQWFTYLGYSVEEVSRMALTDIWPERVLLAAPDAPLDESTAEFWERREAMLHAADDAPVEAAPEEVNDAS